MDVETFGPRRTAILEQWATHVATTASGPNFDFTEQNRTTTTQQRVIAFLDDPTEDRFEDVWSRDAIADSVMGGAAGVLNCNDSIDGLAETVREIKQASEYDQSWESHFLTDTSVWELYGRLHPETAPIINSEVTRALTDLGFSSPGTHAEARDTWESFSSVYQSLAGHATQDTTHAAPLNHEIGEFLWFLAMNDTEAIADVLHNGSDEYVPISRWKDEAPLEQDLQLNGHLQHVDGYAEAERSGGFEENGAEDLWNKGFWEDWKDEYLEHLDNNVRPEYDLTNLSASDVEPFLDDLNVRTSLNTKIPTYILGGRSGGIVWGQFETRSLNDPEKAATVLSSLFDEDEELTLRLDRFIEHYGTLDGATGGPLMTLATMLLCFAYPTEYGTYKYGLMHGFFDEYADFNVDQGFNPRQYWKLNLACKTQLLEELQTRLDEKAVTMLDVYTLLYVWDRNHKPDS